MIAAEKAGKTPQQFVADIAAGRKQYLDGFLIRYDNWHSTDSAENIELSRAIYKDLKAAGLIEVRAIEQFFDPQKGMFLPDRYIKKYQNIYRQKSPAFPWENSDSTTTGFQPVVVECVPENRGRDDGQEVGHRSLRRSFPRCRTLERTSLPPACILPLLCLPVVWRMPQIRR